MFPLANLRDHGIGAGGFGSEHHNATRFWLLEAPVMGVVAINRRGMIMAVVPEGCNPGGVRGAMQGVAVTGAVGESTATRRVMSALGLDASPTLRDADEPGFSLLLENLLVPQVANAQLIVAEASHRQTLLDWRMAYHLEIMGTSADQVAAIAERDVAGYLAAGSHRLLVVAGLPVALTGFNAALPDIVQVGGVYVPPELRRRGYARAAVALHLAQARAQGVARAVLFAANAAAARAYRGIGFQPAKSMSLILFDGPQKVQA